MVSIRSSNVGLALLFLFLIGISSFVTASVDAAYRPPWSSIAPVTTVTHNYDAGLTSGQNGVLLRDAINALTPGQKLIVKGGVYRFNAGTPPASSPLIITVQGTSSAPIWIEAASGESVILSQNNASVPDIQIGNGAQYVSLQGFEITGGEVGVRFIGSTNNIWVSENKIHDTGDAGIKARTGDADFLYLTGNEIYNTSGFGEGISLGDGVGNDTRNSIIAENHIHNTSSNTNGDGVRLSWNSNSNLIAENYIHHTAANGPCIFFDGYSGTQGGSGRNVIERNVVHDCGDNGIQAESGGALVQNNLLIGPFGNKAFDNSHIGPGPNEGGLTVIHNTIIAGNGYGAGLNGWNGQPNMVFANNISYVNGNGNNGYTIHVFSCNAGCTITNNVVYRTVSNNTGLSNFPLPLAALQIQGTGFGDFENVSNWSPYTSIADYTPDTSGTNPILGSGSATYDVPIDILGNDREGSIESGALDAEATAPPNLCGNGNVDSGEVCDPPNSTQSCIVNGNTGNQRCNSTCTGYNACLCTAQCGAWGACVNNTQSRTCVTSACGNTVENQACTPGVVCGNGILESGEQCETGSTLQACVVSGYNGTQICDLNTCQWNACTTNQSCGDNVCNGAETTATCVQDCPATQTCGDGTCSGNENSSTCSQDCPVSVYCGDGSCNGNENSSTCSSDCGAPPYCGDNSCNGSENTFTCEQDCPAPSFCGDSTCNFNESYNSCPQDCPTTPLGTGNNTPGGGGGGGNSGGGSGNTGTACVPQTEQCDGIDNNCNNQIDEGCPVSIIGTCGNGQWDLEEKGTDCGGVCVQACPIIPITLDEGVTTAAQSYAFTAGIIVLILATIAVVIMFIG